ncbi:hypothetical protein PHYBLDRAFT_169734 [Phycomyces blakesleeanus NRRL 1555(-)]|uniref:Uncharacterized protein n=1 Tax=Phycomyces blakesleeanus (strain ATCC 8743b / DSM 1359 / FGSC 10004 / NBRC 33097 / NRRL 1555) TaxID=763407 RepID=A0A163ACX0_PHYB8|nr:hypothetical protein PHYBLDRAFT_169734 [Phycomyces blakesleeanus NRRL 1555(-)]OAD72611.1 hypothetical protein PHYBLDRAFT_169734 [Phycomyces blakesleeanus NRRL 1555(-)]|eukprot:XP_018290651.1 hypothetical protein PHYBLDRAFT_169734 [Phycomyces blakesleeanus NRRL 1555(-)]
MTAHYCSLVVQLLVMTQWAKVKVLCLECFFNVISIFLLGSNVCFLQIRQAIPYKLNSDVHAKWDPNAHGMSIYHSFLKKINQAIDRRRFLVLVRHLLVADHILILLDHKVVPILVRSLPGTGQHDSIPFPPKIYTINSGPIPFSFKKIIIFVGSFNELRFSIFYNTVWDFGTKVERAQFPLIRRDKDLTIHFNRYLNFISEVLRDL